MKRGLIETPSSLIYVEKVRIVLQHERKCLMLVVNDCHMKGTQTTFIKFVDINATKNEFMSN